MFWFTSVLLTFLASLFVLLPLWKFYRGEMLAGDLSRNRINLGIFEQRRVELENDLASGNLSQEVFDGLILELQKSLLTDIDEQSDAGPTASNSRKQFLIPIAMTMLLVFAVYPLYQQWGHLPDIEPRELYERTFGNVNNDQEVARELIIALDAIVQRNPENGWAWYFLARNFSTIGQFQEAEIGFAQAVANMDDSADKAAVLGQYAQVKYIMASGQLTDEVMEIVNEARLINPNEWSILQLLSIDAEMHQNYAAAISYWRLMIQANPNSAEARVLRNSIATAQQLLAEQQGTEVAPGPRIEVRLSLAEGLQLAPDLRVFVAARNAAREGMPPLAAMDLYVSELPVVVSLDDNSAVGTFNLSSADTVYISALVSRSGTANVQSGDYRVVSENFAHNGQHSVIELVISDVVP